MQLTLPATANPRPTAHPARPLHSSNPPLQRGYAADWLGGTFSQAVFLGNGLMAILSGWGAGLLACLLAALQPDELSLACLA